MNIYNFLAGGTALNTVGIVPAADFLAWLKAFAEANTQAVEFKVSSVYVPDSAATLTRAVQIQITTKVRVVIPTPVLAVQGVLRVEELFLDQDMTDIVTAGNKGYVVKGNVAWAIHTALLTTDLKNIKYFLLTHGVFLQMGTSQSTLTNNYTPFSAAKAVIYFDTNSIAVQKRELRAKEAVGPALMQAPLT